MNIYTVEQMSDILIQGFIDKIKEDELDLKQANLELYLDNTMFPEKIGICGVCKIGSTALGNAIDANLEDLEPRFNAKLLKEDRYEYIKQYNNLIRPLEDALIIDARLSWNNYVGTA